MSRTARHDADYFPFFVKDGKTLFILESKYGLQGIGFFTNLMRFLCKQPDHHICIEAEPDRLYFFAQIRCQEDIGTDMLNLMAKTGKIDADLWASRRVIVSSDLLNSLIPLYQKRTNLIITIDQIRLNFPGKAISAPDMTTNGPFMPQSKVKESKVKKSIVPPDKKLFLEVVYLTDTEHQKLTAKYGPVLTTKAIEILNNAIQSKGYKYKSHYHTLIGWPMREAQGGNGNGKNPGTYRTDIRGHQVQDEQERINAEWRAKRAAQKPARDSPGGIPGDDDAPDFQAVGT